MPEGLDIDREQSLNGLMAAYADQVLISTGKPDWTSKIEDESDAVFLRQMRKYLTRGGKYVDPFHNILLTNSSILPSTTQSTSTTAQEARSAGEEGEEATASAYLLPSFEYIPHIPTSDDSIQAFIKAFVLPAQLHAHHDVLSREQKNVLLREPTLRKRFPGVRKVDEILVLVCGHGGRDQRCGVLGPILKEEFEDKLARQDIAVLKGPPLAHGDEVAASRIQQEEKGETRVDKVSDLRLRARVATISHIGGHKFAGNVIIYIPPSFKGNALAGKGIWYGRIEPGHVEGIVAKTVLEGKVIKEHFRGGIGAGGEVMRL